MKKFAIYQVLPRLFGNKNSTKKYKGNIKENGCGKLNDFTPKALKAINNMGFTHIWYTGIMEHATQTDYTKHNIRKDNNDIVKGKAGSPYAIKDYYDVDPDLAENVDKRIEEFEQLVERTHDAKMKVIIDFVPNHTSREYHSDKKPKNVRDFGETDNPDWAFSPLNNYYYIPNTPFSPQFATSYVEFPAKATGDDQFTAYPTQHNWYETVKLNYGVNYTEGMQKQFDPIPNTWHKMLDILLYWAEKKVNGFRVDMAEMVPVEFWHWVIKKVKNEYPDIIFIAEVYNPNEYRNYICNGGFDYLYDKVGMYDTLRGIMSKDQPARALTGVWQSLHGIEDQMLNFLENHDEQRIGSGFFCGSGEYAKSGMIVSATLTKAPFMIYFGQELGEQGMEMEGFSGLDGRTTIFDYWALNSIQNWVNDGKFNTVKLTKEQKELRNFYKKLIHVSLSEKAISKGEKYDLAFANSGQHHFNTHWHYAYFRKYKEEIILCVINFQDTAIEMEVNIPSEAFQYLNIKEDEEYQGINLLEKKEEIPVQTLSSKNYYRVSVPAWNGKIIKLKKV